MLRRCYDDVGAPIKFLAKLDMPMFRMLAASLRRHPTLIVRSAIVLLLVVHAIALFQ